MKTEKRTLITCTVLALALLAVTVALLTRPAGHTAQRPHEDSPATSVSTAIPASNVMASPPYGHGSQSPTRQHHEKSRQQADVDIERLLRQPGAISLDASERLLQSDDLSSRIAALRQQHGQDSEANDITALYRRWVVGSLADFSPRMWLNDLQCGLSICIGMVTTAEPESVARAWPSSLLAARTLPVFGYVDTVRGIEPGKLEYRFIFSTDPGAGGLRFKASPPR